MLRQLLAPIGLLLSVLLAVAAPAPDRQSPAVEPDPFEAQIEKSLKAQGAYVNRDEQAPGKPIREIINVRNISDAELRSLAGVRRLHHLQLVNVGDAQVKVAAGLQQLRRFSVCGDASLTDAGIAELNRLPSLEEVMVQCGTVTQEGIKALTGSRRLKTLGLQSVALTDTGMKHLAEFKELRWLYLNTTQVTGEQLSSVKQVRSLYLYGNPLTPAGIKELGKLTNLRELTVGHRFIDENVKELVGLTHLEMLNLQQNPAISAACLKWLVEMEELQDLWLSDTAMTGAGFKQLAGHKKLRGLYLYSTPTNDAGLKEIAAIKSLEKLWLSRTPITDAGLKHLAGLPNLRELVVAETRLSAEALSALQKALPRCKILGAPSDNQGLPGISP
jgi:internalin A